MDFGRVSSTFDFDVLMLKFEGLQSFRMWMWQECHLEILGTFWHFPYR